MAGGAGPGGRSGAVRAGRAPAGGRRRSEDGRAGGAAAAGRGADR